MATETIRVWSDDDEVHFAEGHHDPDVFMAAVNAYIDECGVRADQERWGVHFVADDVEHRWFTPDADDEELMHPASEGDAGAFAVTLVRPALRG